MTEFIKQWTKEAAENIYNAAQNAVDMANRGFHHFTEFGKVTQEELGKMTKEYLHKEKTFARSAFNNLLFAGVRNFDNFPKKWQQYLPEFMNDFIKKEGSNLLSDIGHTALQAILIYLGLWTWKKVQDKWNAGDFNWVINLAKNTLRSMLNYKDVEMLGYEVWKQPWANTIDQSGWQNSPDTDLEFWKVIFNKDSKNRNYNFVAQTKGGLFAAKYILFPGYDEHRTIKFLDPDKCSWDEFIFNTLTIQDLTELFKDYQKWAISPQRIKILYDKLWKEIVLPDKSMYYRFFYKMFDYLISMVKKYNSIQNYYFKRMSVFARNTQPYWLTTILYSLGAINLGQARYFAPIEFCTNVDFAKFPKILPFYASKLKDYIYTLSKMGIKAGNAIVSNFWNAYKLISSQGFLVKQNSKDQKNPTKKFLGRKTYRNVLEWPEKANLKGSKKWYISENRFKNFKQMYMDVEKEGDPKYWKISAQPPSVEYDEIVEPESNRPPVRPANIPHSSREAAPVNIQPRGSVSNFNTNNEPSLDESGDLYLDQDYGMFYPPFFGTGTDLDLKTFKDIAGFEMDSNLPKSQQMMLAEDIVEDWQVPEDYAVEDRDKYKYKGYSNETWKDGIIAAPKRRRGRFNLNNYRRSFATFKRTRSVNDPTPFKLSCSFRAWHWGDYNGQFNQATSVKKPIKFFTLLITGETSENMTSVAEDAPVFYSDIVNGEMLVNRIKTDNSITNNIFQMFNLFSLKGVAIKISCSRNSMTNTNFIYPASSNYAMAVYWGKTQVSQLPTPGSSQTQYDILFDVDSSMRFTTTNVNLRPFSKYFRANYESMGWGGKTYNSIDQLASLPFAIRIANQMDYYSELGPIFDITFDCYICLKDRNV